MSSTNEVVNFMIRQSRVYSCMQSRIGRNVSFCVNIMEWLDKICSNAVLQIVNGYFERN